MERLMTTSVGFLLPTRELVMEGRPETRELLRLATRAEALGFDSLWVGDSLLARPRHEPLSLLSAVAAVTERATLGTAVLLPVLRNPVLLAHQAATLDQLSEGRLVLGVGIGADNPAVRAEFTAAGVPFEGRVGRMLEGIRLCRALWSGEAVEWDGRWKVDGRVLGPVPHRPGGPPIWLGSGAPAALARVGKHFDGWFPLGPDAASYGPRWDAVQQAAREAGREDSVTPAMYLTVSLNPDPAVAEQTLDRYLEQYYSAPAAVLRRGQACYAGTEAGLDAWLREFVAAGARHLVMRFAGEHDRHLETVAGLRAAGAL